MINPWENIKINIINEGAIFFKDKINPYKKSVLKTTLASISRPLWWTNLQWL
jgi:hypothetical protein